jgi:catechol 2,3-dioxygenase-like lactoylglutathione lyase family enzyme
MTTQGAGRAAPAGVRLVPHNDSLDVGIVVEELAACETFYGGILGLEKLADRQTTWGPMVEFAFGRGVLRLMQAAGAPRQTSIGLDASTGIRYVTFDIDNFDEAVEACRGAGVEFWLDVEPIRDLFIAMVKDPEGNIVEFIGHSSGDAA